MRWLERLLGKRPGPPDEALPIASARDGRVRLSGRVGELGPLLRAPSDGAHCVWYLTEAETVPGPLMTAPKYRSRFSAREGVVCRLEDASGVAIVDLAGARVEGMPVERMLSELDEPAHHWIADARQRAKHPPFQFDAVLLRELRVCPGDGLWVEGRGVWSTDVPDALGLRASGYRESPRVFLVDRVRRAWLSARS